MKIASCEEKAEGFTGAEGAGSGALGKTRDENHGFL